MDCSTGGARGNGAGANAESATLANSVRLVCNQDDKGSKYRRVLLRSSKRGLFSFLRSTSMSELSIDTFRARNYSCFAEGKGTQCSSSAENNVQNMYSSLQYRCCVSEH